MGVQNPNSTNYQHPNEPNLLDLTNAMTYDPVNGEPHLRVTLGSDTITINGEVNLVDNVRINNTEQQSIPVHLTDDPIAVTQSGTWTVGIGSNGTVSLSADTLSALENINATVSGTVELGATTLSALENIGVTGTFWQATQPVSIDSLPEIEIKNDTGNPIPISATTAANSLANPISIQITKNGLAVSDTVALPTRVLNDEGLIAYARHAPVTEADVLNSYLIDKSGATDSLGITPATMTTVWDGTGLYPWNTFTGTGDKLYVKTSTDDPKVRGKTVILEGLDSNYNLISETITLNGSNSTTAVSTTLNFYRTVRATLSGTNTNYLPHDYDIEIHYGSSSGTVVEKITAPYGRTQSCIYTVPAGYEAFILSVNGSSGHGDEITSMIWTRPYNDTWRQIKTFKFISGTYEHNFRTPLKIPEKSDLEMRAYALVESSRVSVEFQLLVIPKV